MRPVHIFLLAATLTACCLSSCQTARQATPRTLILFYDPAIGPAPLLHTAERCEATLVYHYETSTASPCPSPAAKAYGARHAVCDGLKASCRFSPTDKCPCIEHRPGTAIKK